MALPTPPPTAGTPPRPRSAPSAHAPSPACCRADGPRDDEARLLRHRPARLAAAAGGRSPAPRRASSSQGLPVKTTVLPANGPSVFGASSGNRIDARGRRGASRHALVCAPRRRNARMLAATISPTSGNLDQLLGGRRTDLRQSAEVTREDRADVDSPTFEMPKGAFRNRAKRAALRRLDLLEQTRPRSSRPSGRVRRAPPASAGRAPTESVTPRVSTSCATSFSPRPSMSIARARTEMLEASLHLVRATRGFVQ